MADKDLNPKLAALRSLEESLHRHLCAEAAAAESGHARQTNQARQTRRRRRGRVARAGWRGLSGRLADGARAAVAGVAAFGRAAIEKSGRLAARAAQSETPRRLGEALGRWLLRPAIRRTALALGALLLTIAVAGAGLWWRLASGPIPFNALTPWLTAAVAQNLGHRYRVEIGGTVLELDENRRMAIRMRDIALRDSDGAVVASAPRAEAGVSLASLLSGRPRAESINLVGAELALRIDAEGKLNVFAGADKRPLATSPAIAAADAAAAPAPPADQPARPPGSGGGDANVAALLNWIDSLATFGLDGGELAEIGLKSGSLIVDDARTGRQSRFDNIHLTLARPQPGELSLTLGSQDAARPWVLVAAVKPVGQGSRAVRFEARKVSVRDILLALRLDEGRIDADLPVSASLRAEIASDGTPHFANGRVLVGPGAVGEAGDQDGRIAVDRLEANFEWDAARRAVVAPFQFVSGPVRMTLAAQAEAPIEPGGAWSFGLRGGSVVIAGGAPDDEALLLNRVLIRGRLDPAKRRLDVPQAEVAGMDVNIAASGFVDFATSDPRLVLGMAARPMSGASFKRMWPPFVNPKVRAWAMENMAGGMVERVEVATNAPLSTLKDGGPPVPDDGLSIELMANGVTVRLVDALPPIRDADIAMRVRGRNASIAMGRGGVELPSGRKLSLANGLFEVPDTHGKRPPAKVRVRADGPAPAAAELLAMEPLREASGAPLDPATTRGTVSAQIAVSLLVDRDPPKDSLTYSIVADVTNFAVDRFVMSHKIEAQTLRVAANTQGYQLKGDVRIAGTPAAVEYRKGRNDSEAEVRLQAVLDDAARARFGFDSKGGVTGPIPVKLAGRFAAAADQENRFAVEMDLTQARIDNLLPSWVKSPGKPARAAFNYVRREQATRIEDVAIEGSGAAVKGALELDANGDLVSASFPIFGLSDGDKANLKAERGADGLVKIVLRGDTFDGRAFVKSVLGGSSADSKQRQTAHDFDIDLKVGALVGFNGEALRAVDLKLLRRGGQFENFALSAKIGVDAALIGDLRGRADGGGMVVYFESKDAGALFRFTDIYSKMHGGQMWVAMEPPTAEPGPRDGLLNVRDFTVRGEASLDRVASGAPGQPNPGIEFSRMRVDFARSPGRLTIKEGVVRGPVIGATIDGMIDYAGNEVRMRGTFVPLYGLNNAFGQIPIVGLLLGGGSNEGLVGLTYEVVGTPGAPVLRVNPISALAPGVLRKFLEFPTSLPHMSNDRLPDARSSAQQSQ